MMAFVTIPQLITVLQEAPPLAMINSFLLGMAYGIGGTAFGIAIRYVGFSLTYAIAVYPGCSAIGHLRGLAELRGLELGISRSLNYTFQINDIRKKL